MISDRKLMKHPNNSSGNYFVNYRYLYYDYIDEVDPVDLSTIIDHKRGAYIAVFGIALRPRTRFDGKMSFHERNDIFEIMALTVKNFQNSYAYWD